LLVVIAFRRFSPTSDGDAARPEFPNRPNVR
jgi:hypothetical protein